VFTQSATKQNVKMKQKIVKISRVSREAKYRQIINSIINAVSNGRLKRGDKVPSINDIANEFALSRDTVMLAFNELKAKGIIASVPGIGYFIESTNVQFDQKVFLLFDEFNGFKEQLYNSFLNALNERAQVDIYFHHFNLQVFEALIKDNAMRYTTFVILPGNLIGVLPVLKTLPQEKVIILDQLSEELKGLYSSVYQSFETDIYDCLENGMNLILKYKRFILVYPGGKEPIGFVEGFINFCENYRLAYVVVDQLDTIDIQKGDVYVLPRDSDLVNVVKASACMNLLLGRDIGIISINDMPLKEVVAGGITTISTDFERMGETLASLVLDGARESIRNPAKLIIRQSL
jgi:DNA-binding transcriptional regulator YhcF (GntR family)